MTPAPSRAPDTCSEMATPAMISPAASSRQPGRLLRLAAGFASARWAPSRREAMKGTGAAAAERFGDQRGIEQRQAEPAMGFGDQKRGHAELDKALPDVAGDGFLLLHGGFDAIERADALQRAVHAVLHHRLVGAESEFHIGCPYALAALRFARHAEPALGDDVLLNLRGAAADDQAEIEHVLRCQRPSLLQMRAALIEHAEFAQRIDGQGRELVAQFAALQFDDQPRHARHRRRVIEAVSSRKPLDCIAITRACSCISRSRSSGLSISFVPSTVSSFIRSMMALRRRLRGIGIAQHAALVLQRGVGDEPALPAVADDLVLGHAHVGEEHLVEFGMVGHGLQRAHLDARRLHREHQIGDALMLGASRLGAHQAEDHVGMLGGARSRSSGR